MTVEYVDHMGDDLSVVNAARISFKNKKKKLDDKDIGLIGYLADHSHWTPFAHTAISLRITAPIAIRTQCFKHKVGFVENEESRRYISNPPEVFTPHFRQKPTGNKKQGSSDETFTTEKQTLLQETYQRHVDSALYAYQSLIRNGVAPEQARFVLPQGTYTSWIWTGSLVAYARFFCLRTDPHAQAEVQIIAGRVGEIIQPLFPVSWGKLVGLV